MEKVAITLLSPVKIGGKRHPVGATVPVDPALALELEAGGLATPSTDTPVSSPDDIEARLEARAKEIALSIVEGAVEAAVSELTLDRDGAIARAELADARADTAEARVAELEAQIASLPVANDAAAQTKDAAATPAKARKRSSSSEG